ncbi:coat protein [Lake Sarah-associated circular virus-7]|uniref:Coat protein n=1 Tax=Lake Sarah-associated circular virus-7 TaxID=1685784 RepID=A0A126G8G5_9VIRU|nr:coat protein [Lake Sarah-associated circular virus-7]ALE29599.1 coat protein [Lake Sarah-associated circular virus-7]
MGRRFRKRGKVIQTTPQGQRTIPYNASASRAAFKVADAAGKWLGKKAKAYWNSPTPKVYKKKSKPKEEAKELHTSVNGGGNVINTIVNIGKSNKKQAKLIKKLGAYTTSQYLAAFTHVNTATEASTQEVNDVAVYLKGQSLWDIVQNAYQQNAAWQALAPNLTTAGAQARIYVSYIKTEIEFVNLSPAICFVDIYLFRAKVDQLAFSDVTSAYNLPSNTWATSIDQEKGLGSVSQTFPGMEPRGALFKKHFKEVYKLRCCMNGGEVRRLSIYMHMNKWVESAKIILNKGNLNGLTHHLMFVERGSPCGNLNDPYVADTQVYLSPIKINGTVNTTFGVGCLVRPSNNAYTSQTGLTTSYAANVYTLVDDDGGTKNIGVVDSFG